VAVATAVIDPLPKATLFALPAVAPLPMAIELLPMEVAAGPMATEFIPVAVESASVELVWKYSIPAPFASAFRVLTLLLVEDSPVESDVSLL